MALKLRKDIKKSSYYVWFLGAKESKGLKGAEYTLPVIKHLEQREKDVEPFKVTLQVSHKGLKIIQNVVTQGAKNSKPKNETIKHFIPHNTITYVYQDEDVIACILLLFNPVTKCPLHVHAYRCDSLETASLLKQQLQTLIDRPENQKKIAEIENRLKPAKESKKLESSVGSDTGASTRESDSSEERFALENSRIASLYDSVAAELRAKLGKKNSPILLPPRDYDTVHRQKGNLTGIELRRCLNANIVGQNVKNRRLESSGGSSGIGSDHPPSPESPETPVDSRFHTLDTHSTSEDEDWNGNQADSSLYLIQPSHPVTLPRPSRNQENGEATKEIVEKSPEAAHRFSRYAHEELKFSKSLDEEGYSRNIHNDITKYLEKPISRFSSNKYLERQKSLDKEKDSKLRPRDFLNQTEKYFPSKRGGLKYYDQETQENDKPYFEDDGFDENIRYKNGAGDQYFYEDDVFFEHHKEYREYPVPKSRESLLEKDNDGKRVSGSKERRGKKIDPIDPRYYEPEPDKPARPRAKERELDRYRGETDRQYFEDSDASRVRRSAQYRQRTPSPDEIKAPRDRFNDAKEKFLLMERERLQQERRRPEPPISPTIHKDKAPGYLKRNQSMAYGSKDHLRRSYDESYFNDRSRVDEFTCKPASRHTQDDARYREYNDRDTPLDRYRNTDKFDPKRRSMFSLIEEEHRKNSNEIAKELKRRSYMEVNARSFDGESVNFRDNERDTKNRHFDDLPESDRYNPPIVDNYAKSSLNLDKTSDGKYDPKFVKHPQKFFKSVPAGYRHSYAEPKLRMEKGVNNKYYAEMLQRTNSTASNSNARVGIASVKPY
ncbi:uncharacterized protein LOC132706393 isoform X2 [Cylas formicarius]|nr:uncharacterized protein LOC132706393 isoform X2 [Cylas formicarius]